MTTIRPDHFSPVTVSDPLVLILAGGDSSGEVANRRGHLFEQFVARLLHAHGYNRPTTERLNVTADGIELDVVATSRLSGQPAIAECKAYTSPIAAHALGAFHSKLVVRRFTAPTTQGYFVALPKLTAPGLEQAETITDNDPAFRLLTAADVIEALRELGDIGDSPEPIALASDPAVVVTSDGVYSACLELDPASRMPRRTVVWHGTGRVPAGTLELIAGDDYAQGTSIVDLRDGRSEVDTAPGADAPAVIVPVVGSTSDFEYQLPAAPRYFVGRKRVVTALAQALARPASVIVLNAQSGWGKSSLALKLERMVGDKGGYCLVVDSRTAASGRYITDVLNRAANEAASRGLLELPGSASWASLSSALATFAQSRWTRNAPLMIFFDQFENVFRDPDLTRQFRDLAYGAREIDGLMVGFAWKTDLVGWTESHPYQLRDAIRDSGDVYTLSELEAADVDVLLRRLERAIGQGLARDLRQRLREYSQGLPWLLKKLAAHVLRELADGASQEQLAAEALNVQSLFDGDLAELSPPEQEALRHIARFAPISIGEALDRVSGPIVEALINRRLVVQVGERLDTYWDVFRDYLNTGRIPVQDSYIIRQTPLSVARLLHQVVEEEGDARVPTIAQRLGTSENAVFNLSRELRLLGATAYEANRVRLLDEIWRADDQESELRRRVATSLRRHRAFSLFAEIATRAGKVTIAGFTRELPRAFPAVQVAPKTWQTYARAFLLWFEYAGLALQHGQIWSVSPDGTEGKGTLLRAQLRRRVRGGFPHDPPGPALELLTRIVLDHDGNLVTPTSRDRATARALITLGLVEETADGHIITIDRDRYEHGVPSATLLMTRLRSVPGVPAGLDVLEVDPSADPASVGEAIRADIGAEWSPATAHSVGKYTRAWARHAGVDIQPVPRRRSSARRPSQGTSD